jgi:hypothetical protein
MSRDGSIELQWAGDLRKFRLGIDELIALQDKRDAGPQEIATRFLQKTWRVQDITETLRLGLIGGGCEPRLAQRLIDEQAVPGKLAGSAMVAFAVILSAIQGDEGDQAGKEETAAEKPGAISSQPPKSTEPARSSASPRSK